MFNREKTVEKYIREIIATAEVLLEDIDAKKDKTEIVPDILDDFEEMENLIKLASAKLLADHQPESKRDKIWKMVENNK